MVSVPKSCASTSRSGTGLVITADTTPVGSSPVKSMSLIAESSASTSGGPPSTCPNESLSVQEAPFTDKRKHFPLPLRPACPYELFQNKFQCPACPNDSSKEYSLSEYFIHQFSVHQIISCIYCDEEFQYARDVMGHLNREHRLSNQKFESDEEFLRRGGGRTTVFCVDCNIMLQMSPDNDQNILSNHECRKLSSCRECGLFLENTTIEEHSAICSHGTDEQASITKLCEEQGICKFCKRKLQWVSGQLACSLCEKIGTHNLILKSSQIPVKSSPFVNHLPPIHTPTRKTTKALPPLIPANFGNTPRLSVKPKAAETFIPRRKKRSVTLATKSRDKVSQGSTTFNAELPRINFSSSITVTPLHHSPDEDSDNPEAASIATNHNILHSNLSQENIDLSRPRRSLKRVTHEDFMYDNHLKRRVSNSTVSITPVPPITPGRTNNTRRMNSYKSRNRAPPPQPNVMFEYDSTQNEAEENGIFDENEGRDRLEEEEVEEIPEVKLDPLLLEPDSKKRIILLINELALILLEKDVMDQVGKGGLIESSSDPFSILVSQNSTDETILNQMIEKSSGDCHYCRQVKLIRIDKRQLALHLLRKHTWICRRREVEIDKIKKVQPVKDEKCEDTKINVNESSKAANGIAKAENVPLGEKTDVIGEQLNEPNGMTASSEKIDCDATKDEVKCDFHKEGKESLESRSEEKREEVTDKEVKVEGMNNVSQLPILEDSDGDTRSDDVEVSIKDFYLDILRKVFESPKIVFTYKPTLIIPFGEIPCECLICGFTASSQVNLFPHWRKAHRCMAMKCPMCLGNFLFAGALFSHICLGTPQHFLSTSSVGKVGIGGDTEGQQSGDFEGMREEGTSNDTIFLRYQCWVCEDLQLPGFFNYMVHLRKDHLRCELCLEHVSNQRELEHHIRKHKLNHFCWKCSITYLSKSNLFSHLFWKHGTESQDCSVCLEKKWPHIYHFCIPPPWFTCDVCGLYFTKSKSLRVHKRLHSGEKLRACPQCIRKFISAPLLRKHIAEAHATLLGSILPPEGDIKLNGCESEESEDDEEKKTKDEEILGKVDGEIDKDKLMDLDTKVTDVDEVDNVMISNNEKGNDDRATAETETKTTKEILEKEEQIEDTVGDSAFAEQPQKVVNSKSKTKRDPMTIADDLSAQYFQKKHVKNKKSRKGSKNTRRKHSKFKIDKIHGPDLSEDEVSDSSSSSTSSTSDNEKKEKAVGASVNISSENEVDMMKESDPPVPLAEPPNECLMEQKKTDLLSVPPERFIVPATLGLSNSMTSTKSNSSLNLLYCPFEGMKQLPKYEKLKIGDLSGATPRLDLSSTATAMLFDEKSILESPLSPLIHPLDEFNLNVPEIPTFEENSLPDHISRENALRSILNEHDYCMRRHVSVVVSGSLKRKSHHGVLPIPEERIQIDTPPATPAKKLKVLKPEPKAAKTAVGKKRKRKKSSSSSSSSSSCSSCGSNCSCSSGTSSSSSSDSDSSDSSDSDSKSDTEQKKPHVLNPIPPTVQTQELKPTLQTRGRKPKVKVDQPPKVKKPKGRPPKTTKRLKPSEIKKPTTENGLGEREIEILKHFTDPNDAFILEEDLDTEDSDSDDIFYKKQLSESVIPSFPLLDEPWTAGNEKFLLNEVKGVKELEELRPKPLPPKSKIIHTQKKAAIKPLILRPSFGNIDDLINENDPNMSVMIGNTRITGKGSLQTSLSSSSYKNTITITRGTLTAATAMPASSLHKGNKKLKSLSGTASPKPATVSSYVNTSPSVSKPKSTSQKQTNSTTVLNNSVTLAETSTPSSDILQTISFSPTVKVRRRARMKVTETKSKAPNLISPPLAEVYETTEPDEKLYCICQGPHDNVSQMIGCDADDCPYQWFHFECVGIVVAPKGKWFCQDCRDKRRKKAFQPKETDGIGDSHKTSIITSNKTGSRHKGFVNNTFIGHTVS